MRKIILMAVVLSAVTIVNAQQNIGIGTNSPHSSAMLDVTSPFNNKGILIPRMTATQRGNIPTPAPGLMVYETTTNSFWFFNGSGWNQIGTGGASPWTVNGNIIYNSNSGDVGIGISAPVAKLHIVGDAIVQQGPLRIENAHTGISFRWNNSTMGHIDVDPSGDFNIGTNVTTNPDGNLRLEIQGSPKLVIQSDGNVGIGTISPDYKLEVIGNTRIASSLYVDGGNLLIDDGAILMTNTTNSRNWMLSNSSSLGGRLVFLQQGSEKFVIQNDGKTGIAPDLPITTNFPLTSLHVETGQDADLSSTANGYVMLGKNDGTNMAIDNNEIMVKDGATTAGTLFLQNDGGALSIGAPTTINVSAEALKINGTNPYMAFYTGGTFQSLIGHINDNLRMDAGNGDLQVVAQDIRLTPNGASGQVSIGVYVSAASGYKLTVDGKVLCEELKVKLRSSGWPDYVFGDDHKLLSLTELEKYIQEHKHLPNIPSAVEIDANGIEVGDMQKRMMEKIEELTLYIIDLKKEIEILKVKK